MGTCEHEREQSRGEASHASTRARQLGWAVRAVCAGAIWTAAACGEDSEPARDIDRGVEEATADDDDGDDDDEETPPTASKPDAGGKIDSGTPSREGGASTTPKIDAGTTKMDGSVVVTNPSTDGATSGDDASTGTVVPSGPRTLPTPDLKGPYEVVKLENVGVGFENPPTQPEDQGDGSGCQDFIKLFGESDEDALDYAKFGPDYKVNLYTLYYPKDMVEGQLYPILSWANGTCAKTNGYDALLSHLASHGFIVVATNSRYTGSGKFQLRAVDYVISENDKPESPLYKHVDTAQVGVFGHSQGGTSSWAAANDKRVKTSVILNSTGSGTRPTPSFFFTGDKDILFVPEGALSAARAQTSAAYVRLHKIEGDTNNVGHITLMKEPARVYPAVAAWFRYHLLGDEVGRSWFVGTDCKLCNQPQEWEFFAKGLK